MPRVAQCFCKLLCVVRVVRYCAVLCVLCGVVRVERVARVGDACLCQRIF